MLVGRIDALVIEPGSTMAPGKQLNVAILVEVPRTQLNRAESECVQIIDNFRKAELPSEFYQLRVSAELPTGYRRTEDFVFSTFDGQTFCAYVIKTEELINGSPARQQIKDWKLTEEHKPSLLNP